MENPHRRIVNAFLLVILGILIGAIPGGIKIDEIRGQSQTVNDIATSRIADLEKKVKTGTEATQECREAILGDGAVTVLADQNHPYGGKYQTIFGAALTLPDDGNPALPYGPVWVIHRRVTPQVEDGALGGVYTHIFPDGKSDGWHVPLRAVMVQ